jgi:hypothetical protein
MIQTNEFVFESHVETIPTESSTLSPALEFLLRSGS